MADVGVTIAVHGEHSALRKSRVIGCGQRMGIMMVVERCLRLPEFFAAQEFVTKKVTLKILAPCAQAVVEVGEQHLGPLTGLASPSRPMDPALNLLAPGFTNKIFLGKKGVEEGQGVHLVAAAPGQAQHFIDGEV